MQDFTPSEQLIQFLDGELPIEQEQNLFDEIALNPDLRSEMRDGLAMRSAIAKDVEAFTPTPDQTRAVFAGLGFSPPYAGSSGNNRSYAKYLPLIWLFLGLSIGSGLASWLSKDSFEKQYAALKNKMQTTIDDLNDKLNNNRPVMSSVEVPNKDETVTNTKEKVRTVIVYRDRIVPMMNFDDDSGAYEENSYDVAANQDNVSENDQQVISAAELQMPIALNHSTPFNSPNISLNGTVKGFTGMSRFNNVGYPRFWTQIRGIGTISQVPNISINSGIAELSNLNVSVGYSFNENFAAGIELGREPFMLRYNGIAKGRRTLYEQQSSMLLGGIVFQGKLSPFEALYDVQPVCSMFLGGSEIGPLARFSTGLQYPITQAITLYGGLEYSLLQFQFQSNSFMTQKLGFTYGMQINL